MAILEQSVPGKVLEDCGYKYEYPIPPITRHEGLTGSRVAYYNKANMKIGYEKGNVDSVSHETVHFIVDEGQFNEWCLEELLAYVVQYAVAQDLKIRNLELEMERK